MKKYIEVFRVTASTYLVHRLSFVLWRLRVVITLLITFFLWTAIFESRTNILGYTREKMITYILLSAILGAFSYGTRTHEIASDILQGNIINYILKPISFFEY